ncbi:MAG: TrkH family potassium uptake protein [Thermodesulfobacteriota bacterium]
MNQTAPSYFTMNLSDLFIRLNQRLTPPRALVLSFALLILIGSLALKLPGFTGPEGISYLDALFTSTSAVCVTGLIVVDTPKAFTLPGQITILALIQLGGLGIMTFSVFLYRLAGRDVSIRTELAVRDSLSYTPDLKAAGLARSVFVATIIIELIGAFLLFLFWLPEHGVSRASLLGAFHAVSAFCNAGFSLFSDSLTGYATHYGINLVIMVLIVSGGIGFIVLNDFYQIRRPGRWRARLHTKVAGWTTVALIASGAVLFLFFEWDNVLKGFILPEKIIIALFQSITPRTAGFNTVDYGRLTNATILTTMMLMFVGGSPGSTAGGIKTVTFALIIALGLSRYRGYSLVNLFKRSVPDEIVSRGITISMISFLVVSLSISLLLISETGPLDPTASRGMFQSLLFEVFSAFGTVGLSMGVTANLTAWGKLIIIGTMFLGRLGPLTVAMALLERLGARRRYNFGSEEVMVG